MSLRKALIALLFVVVPTAATADGLALGFAAPVEGPYAAVARQMISGAELAAETRNVALTVADEGCTPEGGVVAANAFVAAKVKAVAGFACLESLSAALPILTKAGIPVIITGVRADSVIEGKAKTEFNVYRLGPADRMEGEALAAELLERWSAVPFAIIDDGTIHARDLAEGLRAAASEKNLKPVFFDTFRSGLDNQSALARRLAKAGAKAVFMGGDVEDALVLSMNASDLGFNFEIAMGESAAPSATPKGMVLALALPDYAAMPEASAASVAMRLKGVEAENVALTAHAAIELLAAALNSGSEIDSGSYTTVIGEVAFDASGERSVNPWLLALLNTDRNELAQ